ncbi:MAG: RCC1 domain-containing protein, partial [Candidatus Poseidoniaceae archaeon]
YTVNANASSGSSGGSGSGSGSGSSTSSTSSFVYANDKISSGGQHTCAILDNGEMKCWGMNTYGQLGIGFNIGGVSSNGNHLQPPSITIDFGTGRTPVKVSSGGLHACALLDNDDVKCWGSRGEGRLGIGGSGSGTEPEPPTTAINFGTSSKVIDVGAGGQHSCALLENGDVKCWGRAYRYRLGLTSSSDFYQPGLSAILPTGRTAVAMDVGLQGASCVILDSGNVSCWGEPHGSYQPYVEIGVGTGRQAVAISVGDDHYCIILDNGDLKCWGSDQYGQLGDGGPAWSTSNPTSVSAPPSTAINLGAGRTAVALATGERHTCAILDNGEVKCWGGDSYGQLGNGPTITANQGSPSSTSVDLGTGRTAVAISAGNHHTCAILDNGDMKCWGGDYRGQLGDGGTATNQESPGSVAGNNAWDTTTTAVTWETHPALPAGMSIS